MAARKGLGFVGTTPGGIEPGGSVGKRGGGVRSKEEKRYRVAVAHSFLKDVETQITWLTENRDAKHLASLKQELTAVRDALSELPLLGTLTEAGLRQLLLRTLPFVVWYRIQNSRLLLLRLFHARQSR
jgi:plasmid stabilization system protein ParE